MMDLFSIIDRFCKNEYVSDSELSLLLRWFLSRKGQIDFENDIEKKMMVFEPDDRRDYSSFLDRINFAINSNKKANRKFPVLHLRRIAAIVIPLLLLGGTSLYFGLNNVGSGQRMMAKVEIDAKLTMPDGTEIILNRSTENGQIASHDNIDIIHSAGSLIYQEQEYDTGTYVPEEIVYSDLSVPKGMTFDVILADGSHVWLNAESKLYFPSRFGSKERRVVLEGEGYFEVKTDNERPFIVEYGEQELTVLGTRFNIYAYPGEQKTVTTLVEGSIALSLSEDYSRTTLNPGQQAVFYSGTDSFVVNDVNAEDTAIWRDGIFPFDGLRLEDVFVKLSKWYDFEYIIDDAIKELTFMGNIRVYDDVASIFTIIEQLETVDITRKDNFIRVSVRK